MSKSASSLGGKTKHKLVLLGDQGTGKSSIIERFINDRYAQESNPTIGIDFLSKNFIHNNRTYRLQLWDTAGQERFKSLIPGYLKDSVCAVFVYDCTNIDSFHNIEKWMSLYRQNKPEKAACVICANKTDLRQEQTPTEKEGQLYAQKNGFLHFQVSAKTGENIQNLFAGTIEAIMAVNRQQQSKEPKTPALEPIMEKAPASSAYEYVNPAASTNRTSRTIQTGAIKLTPEEIEQDRKLLLEGQGGCCKL